MFNKFNINEIINMAIIKLDEMERDSITNKKHYTKSKDIRNIYCNKKKNKY